MNVVSAELDRLAREHLTTEQYEVWRLHEQGLGYRRIAAALCMDESAVRGRVKRAERRLEPHVRTAFGRILGTGSAA